MNIKQLSSDGKIAYLIKPILKVLQEARTMKRNRNSLKQRLLLCDRKLKYRKDRTKILKDSSERQTNMLTSRKSTRVCCES